MRLLGVIPARGGSKRLPNKNILDLGGQPLLKWTLDAAIDSGLFEDGMLWVSSEDEKIGEIAGKYWWRRHPRLATDDMPTMPVIRDVYRKIEPKVDAVVILQPTSPFRDSTDIIDAFDIFSKNEADVLLSTIEAKEDAAFQITDINRICPLYEAVQENGAIYIIRSWVLDDITKSIYDVGKLYSYLMPENRSADIDTELQYLAANVLIKSGIIDGHRKRSRKGY